jgi:glycerol-3-phosphate dehydrogenase
MPLYDGAIRSRSLFRAAFGAERWAARATGLAGTGMEAGLLSASEVRSLYPVPADELAGAAYWHELVIRDTPGLVRSITEQVAGQGGHAVEGQEALELICPNGRVLGLTARDVATGETNRHFADTVFVCAGAASLGLASRFDRDLPMLSARTLAFNLLLDAPAPPHIILALSPTPGRGRSLFFREQAGKLLVGTAYTPATGHPAKTVVPDAEVRSFYDDIVRAAPALAGARIEQVWSGCLPDLDRRGERLRDKDVAWDHGRNGGPQGLHTLTPTKLTTAHALACDVLDRLWPARDVEAAGTGASWQSTYQVQRKATK